MANMTLALPEELKKRMDRFPEINWSEIARQSFTNRLTVLEELDDLLKDSTLTEEDAVTLGRKVRKAVSERHRNISVKTN